MFALARENEKVGEGWIKRGRQSGRDGVVGVGKRGRWNGLASKVTVRKGGRWDDIRRC